MNLKPFARHVHELARLRIFHCAEVAIMAIAVQEIATGQVPGETPNACMYPYG